LYDFNSKSKKIEKKFLNKNFEIKIYCSGNELTQESIIYSKQKISNLIKESGKFKIIFLNFKK
jgi:hypothetical protein